MAVMLTLGKRNGMRQQNREHKALFEGASKWLHKPEIGKTFGIKSYDEMVAENARNRELAGDHPIQ